VIFAGESGIDAGGVYREGLSRMTDDLFSDRFSLLVKCANARKGYKINTDAYVPNSTLKTPLALSMLEFAGRLMGLSLRTKACLSFSFPSIVWKAINGDALHFTDLVNMDGLYAEFLENIRDCDRERVSSLGIAQTVLRTEAEFAKAYPDLRFISFNCKGEEVELLEGGKSMPVLFSNRLQFVEAALQYRLHEFDVQLAALRRGLANTIPIRALSLFTWQEIEILVAGKPEIDVDLLKRNTSYEGFSATSPVIESFWRVFESFTQVERQQLIRFAWGR
jgi:E3 ubiquitin-protein ligase HERC2